MAAAMNVAGKERVEALFWSAVVNGVLAVPVMLAMLVLACSPGAMGQFALLASRCTASAEPKPLSWLFRLQRCPPSGELVLHLLGAWACRPGLHRPVA